MMIPTTRRRSSLSRTRRSRTNTNKIQIGLGLVRTGLHRAQFQDSKCGCSVYACLLWPRKRSFSVRNVIIRTVTQLWNDTKGLFMNQPSVVQNANQQLQQGHQLKHHHEVEAWGNKVSLWHVRLQSDKGSTTWKSTLRWGSIWNPPPCDVCSYSAIFNRVV